LILSSQQRRRKRIAGLDKNLTAAAAAAAGIAVATMAAAALKEPPTMTNPSLSATVAAATLPVETRKESIDPDGAAAAPNAPTEVIELQQRYVSSIAMVILLFVSRNPKGALLYSRGRRHGIDRRLHQFRHLRLGQRWTGRLLLLLLQMPVPEEDYARQAANDQLEGRCGTKETTGAAAAAAGHRASEAQ
jgi:hypothetical protein